MCASGISSSSAARPVSRRAPGRLLELVGAELDEQRADDGDGNDRGPGVGLLRARPRLVVVGERLVADDVTDRVPSGLDRNGVVLPGPAIHRESLFWRSWPRRSWTGRRSRSGSATRLRPTSRVLAPIGLATVLVGDDPASDVYIRLKHKASTEAGIDSRDIRLPATTTEAELLEHVARAERGRVRPRDPRSAAPSGRPRRGQDHRDDRPEQGRRRAAPVQRRPAPPRPPDLRRRDPARRARAARRVRRRAGRCAGGRDREKRHRREAGGAAAPPAARDGHDLPFANARSRRRGRECRRGRRRRRGAGPRRDPTG